MEEAHAVAAGESEAEVGVITGAVVEQTENKSGAMQEAHAVAAGESEEAHAVAMEEAHAVAAGESEAVGVEKADAMEEAHAVAAGESEAVGVEKTETGPCRVRRSERKRATQMQRAEKKAQRKSAVAANLAKKRPECVSKRRQIPEDVTGSIAGVVVEQAVEKAGNGVSQELEDAAAEDATIEEANEKAVDAVVEQEAEEKAGAEGTEEEGRVAAENVAGVIIGAAFEQAEEKGGPGAMEEADTVVVEDVGREAAGEKVDREAGPCGVISFCEWMVGRAEQLSEAAEEDGRAVAEELVGVIIGAAVEQAEEKGRSDTVAAEESEVVGEAVGENAEVGEAVGEADGEPRPCRVRRSGRNRATQDHRTEKKLQQKTAAAENLAKKHAKRAAKRRQIPAAEDATGSIAGVVDQQAARENAGVEMSLSSTEGPYLHHTTIVSMFLPIAEQGDTDDIIVGKQSFVVFPAIGEKCRTQKFISCKLLSVQFCLEIWF